MDKKTALAAVAEFKKSLESSGIRTNKMILFGSFACGQFREDSDIDLIVISEDFRRKTYWERIDILAEAVYDVFQPIEAIAMTPDEWEAGNSLIVDYARNGEVLYG